VLFWLGWAGKLDITPVVHWLPWLTHHTRPKAPNVNPDTGHQNSSTPEQRETARIDLAQGKSVAGTARKVGVATQTVARWIRVYGWTKGEKLADQHQVQEDAGERSRIVPLEQRRRIERLKVLVDTAMLEDMDAQRLKAITETVTKLHVAERQAYGIEDKPPETRAVIIVPSVATAAEWQEKQARELAGPQQEGKD
jgi:transposase-like protein